MKRLLRTLKLQIFFLIKKKEESISKIKDKKFENNY